MDTATSGKRLAPAAVAAGTLSVSVVALVAAAFSLAWMNRGLPVDQHVADPPKWYSVQQGCSALAFVVPGWYLARRAPKVLFGWLLLAAAIGHALAGAGWAYLLASTVGGEHYPATTFFAVLVGPGTAIEVPVLAAVAALYPDGKVPKGWIGVAAFASVALGTLGFLDSFFEPLNELASGPGSALASLHNPIGTPVFNRLDNNGVFLMAPAGVGADLVVLVRWLRAKGELRLVLGWLVAASFASLLFAPLALLGSEWFLLSVQLPTFLVLAALVAGSLRHRIFGIEVVVGRAFVYSALLACVGLVFGVVVGVAALLGNGQSLTTSFLAAAVAALVLAPARSRIESVINRLIYGDRHDPYAVLSRVAAQLEAAGSEDALLAEFTAQVVAALRVPFAAVTYGEGPRLRRVVSGAETVSAEVFPLTRRGETVGALIAGRRTGEREFSPAERQLLSDLARQASAAVANLALTEDRQRSRESIVSAREEERRRLRRDLHDGLGPGLTGAAMMIDAGRNLMARDPAAADIQLLEARAQVKAAIDDVRRLVYALRPPALDELGLVGALREQASRGAMQVTIATDGPLGELPAAVEVAAFRIISEAMTNAARHGNATSCHVGVSLNGSLNIDVADNGLGSASWRPGVGIISMRERAAELGGTCDAGPGADGHGRVHAVIPVGRAR